MKTENLNIEANELQINNAMSDFCPFGYLDIKSAVNAALQAGKDSNYVYECCNEFIDSCGGKMEDLDPVYCVYDAILQEARNEIDTICNFDLMNDANFDTYGNFMCTAYNYDDSDKDLLINALADNGVIIEDLSKATQYFLDSIELTQHDIDTHITENIND